MKQTLTLLLIFISLAAFSQTPLSEWNEESKTNKRLLPKYGHQPKSEHEKEADTAFITEILATDDFKGDRRAASNHMVKLGFNYLYKGDIKTAMYRYNRAYLLDSANADIYWGYGAVYMTLGDHKRGLQMYDEGLSMQPDNPRILTDYATYYMGRYYDLQPVKEPEALKNCDSAIAYPDKSYRIDPKYQSTVLKLSICHWMKGDCENAWKYYKEAEALGGQLITKEYTKDLKKRCKEKN